MHKFSIIFVPGKFLVELFPVLRFLPSWFPGAKFKRQAAEWFPLVRKMRDVPWAAAIDSMVRPSSLWHAGWCDANDTAFHTERRTRDALYGHQFDGTHGAP